MSELLFRADRSPFSWLLEREVVRYLKIWQFTIAGHVVSALLFVLVFGLALGTRIDGVHGVPYDRFIVGGLLGQAVLIVGYINGTTSLFEARRDRYLHDVLASPLRWWEVNLALVLGGVIRGVITGIGILAIAMPLTGATVDRPLVLGLGAAGTLTVAGQVGVLAGAYARTLDHVYSLEALVVLPLGFLGGIFYSVSQLPPFWHALSEVNPVFYIVQTLRIGFLGSGDIPAGVALGVLWAFAVALSSWSLLVFRSGRRLKQ
ncbi:MAG TPA: ABC transporter permease [Solirubrobacteraceae bacterium]|nr:ABC transporter permease [Solirubrobacteraceae bacterium]